MLRKQLSMLLTLVFAISLLGTVPAQAEEIPDVTDYSYTVTPILSPFSYYLYVKTDNPDPTSFRLVDRESKFYDADSRGEIRIKTDYGYTLVYVDPGTYYISQQRYADVVFADAQTYRVPGGYIFSAYGAYSDGGEFTLLQKTSSGSSILDDKFEPTDVTIPCQPLNTMTGYLIDTCTTEDMTFFEKLDAVQARLNQIAVYPRSVYNIDDPNEETPYPLLASSPYPELSLNEHYSMYNILQDGILVSRAYPFVLDSASFPGTLRAVARQLEPKCEITYTGLHYMINVTFGGETHAYGGAGVGGYDPLYSNRVQKVFTFSGGEDLGINGTIEEYYTILRSYEPVAKEDAEKYRDLIQGTTFRQTIRATGGTWIKIATEGFFGYGTSFGYVVPLGTKTMTLSEAWVDGRYIGNHETIVLNEKFEDHPTADITLHDVTFTDRYGHTHTQDVVYSYDETKDAWTAPYFYTGDFWYSTAWQLPDELILTREQVDAMILDYKSGHLPEGGLVYDGTEYPGAPFTLAVVTGVSVPEALALYEGEKATVTATVQPEDAFDTRVTWSTSDASVVALLNADTGLIRAGSEGTAVLTAVTVDGGYSASCKVTVLADPCKDGHSYTETVTPPTCTAQGYTTHTCTKCADSYEDTYTAALGHLWDNGTVTTQPTETETGVMTFTCKRCEETKTESLPAGWKPPCDGGESCPSAKFRDVSTKVWYHSYVDYAVAHGLFSGTSDTTFEPEAAMTRAMLVTVLWRYEGKPTGYQNSFSDVNEKDGKWYIDAVAWAAANGIVGGVGNGKFDPEGNITREQMATILFRYAQKKGIDTTKRGNLSTFPDNGKISAWAKDAMQWAVAEGIINGSDGKLLPLGNATRAQVAAILMRFIENVIKP